MRINQLSLTGIVALLGLLYGGVAMATACTAGAGASAEVGTSSTSDVTLNSTSSTQCEIVDGNSGMGGGNAGLIPTDGFFGGGTWTQIGSDGSIVSATAPGVPVTFTSFAFHGAGALSGSWGLGWTGGPAGVDILFSMHAGGFSGFFEFEGVLLPANASNSGAWLINWLNNGSQVPNESNVQVWVRDDVNVSLFNVPEPPSLALVGLGLLGLVVVRLQQRRS